MTAVMTAAMPAMFPIPFVIVAGMSVTPVISIVTLGIVPPPVAPFLVIISMGWIIIRPVIVLPVGPVIIAPVPVIRPVIVPWIVSATDTDMAAIATDRDVNTRVRFIRPGYKNGQNKRKCENNVTQFH